MPKYTHHINVCKFSQLCGAQYLRSVKMYHFQICHFYYYWLTRSFQWYRWIFPNLSMSKVEENLDRGGSRIFFRRGCTRLLLHIVFFLQNTSCIRKPQVISGGGAHLLHPPPRSAPAWKGLLISKVRGLHAIQFGSNWIQKILLTA